MAMPSAREKGVPHRAGACSGALLLALGTAFPVHAQMTWRSAPEMVVHEPGGAGGHDGHGRRSTGIYLRNGNDAVVSLWNPSLVQSPLAPAKPDGQVVVRPTGVDNYHLLVAKRQSPAGEEVALRYMYMRGKPSDESPSRLLGATKVTLEIVPSPLPREHWRYQTSTPAVFIIRLDGKPLPGQPVRLVTTNGTLMEALTDQAGKVRFQLPEDFSHVLPGRESNVPAEFIVSTAYGHGDSRHLTSLSAQYHVNPSHWESSLGGMFALLAGFVGGMALWRRLPTEGRSP